MKRKNRKRRNGWGKVFLAGIITATIAYVIFGIIDTGFKDLLTRIGIINYYFQGLIIIVILSTLLLIIGYKLKHAYIDAVT